MLARYRHWRDRRLDDHALSLQDKRRAQDERLRAAGFGELRCVRDPATGDIFCVNSQPSDSHPPA